MSILSRMFLILTILFCFGVSAQMLGQEKLESKNDCKCDLSHYDPVMISHFLSNSVKKRVEPEYPSAAETVGAIGEVKVIIIVDRKGNVIDACVATGHPLLRSSAKNAALQWKFKKNFGLTLKQKKKYIQASLYFRFE